MASPPISVAEHERSLLVLASHYGNAAEVERFVAHARQLALPDGWRVRVSLCDNSGDWPGPDDGDGFTMARPGDNLGYFGGAAHALRCSLDAGESLPRWVAVANTDLALASDFVTRLAALDVGANVGVIAPAIETDDGTPQNPYLVHRTHPLRMLLYRGLYRSGLATRAYAGLSAARSAMRRRTSAVVTQPLTIYAPHGAFVLFHDRFFRAGGRLEFGGFMYGEEHHVAEQARRLRLSVRYEPSLRIVHHHHAVVGGIALERRRTWHRESCDFLWREYFAAGARSGQR